jgi:protein-L-isoaspartate(D-aspartate) O-methyltransferase
MRRALAVASAAALCAAAACRPVETSSRESEGAARENMIRTQIAARGIRDRPLLAALRAVPRHLFVDPAHRAEAYADRPVPIGEGQTMTQPYLAALMTELLDIQATDRILEIGTGSGYETAVLSRLGSEVYSIEILPNLSRRAQERLRSLDRTNVRFRIGDGYGGWPEAAPFDGILVSAAPRRMPPALLDQLAPNGRLVIPVGDFFQELKVYAKDARGNVTENSVIPVRFSTMSGEAQEKARP